MREGSSIPVEGGSDNNSDISNSSDEDTKIEQLVQKKGPNK